MSHAYDADGHILARQGGAELVLALILQNEMKLSASRQSPWFRQFRKRIREARIRIAVAAMVEETEFVKGP